VKVTTKIFFSANLSTKWRKYFKS